MTLDLDLFSYLRPLMRDFLLILLVFCGATTSGQIPPGYYDDAQGLVGQPLRMALHDIIDDHNAQSYSSMWGHFESTDNKGSNIVWDIYSDVPSGTPAYTFQFVSDQCGNYGGEGDCFNREHSFPQSWYGSGTPMKSDFFHVYPTDGYVNGQRSNDPFGEVDNPFWTSTNGSRSGMNVFPGYSGNVFEPIDEYKGDLARSYFYMLTRYMDVSGSWSSPMLNAGDLSVWAEDLLVLWHQNDPVSIKELDRNNAIHDIQDNRNPYIDHPEWVEEIWSSTTSISEADAGSMEMWYAESSIHLSSSLIGAELAIYNAQGKEYMVQAVNSERSIMIDLPAGIYLGKIQKDNVVLVIKFAVSN